MIYSYFFVIWQYKCLLLSNNPCIGNSCHLLEILPVSSTTLNLQTLREYQDLILFIMLITPLAIFPLFFKAFLPNNVMHPKPSSAIREPYLLKQLGHRPSLLRPTRILLHAQHIFSSFLVFVFISYILHRYQVYLFSFNRF